MSRKLVALIAILLLTDVMYSAWQYYHGTLDGDMASIVLPAERYRQILEDPFGVSIIRDDAHYGGANRYFAHAFMAAWFRTVPFAFQWVVSPLTSVYLSCALLNILTQVWLIWLLAVYATGSLRIRSKKFLLAALLVTPFFQTTGYGTAMNIIEIAPTYVFFYALGFALLLTFFLPLYLAWCRDERPSGLSLTLLGLGAVVVAFHGPLNVPVLLLAIAGAGCWQAWAILNRRRTGPATGPRMLPRGVIALALWCLALCAYSLYIGRNNAENFWNDTVSLADRYRRLPHGIYAFFIGVDGCLILLALVLLNAGLLLRFRHESHAAKLLRLLGWLTLFCSAYLLLVPFGGYRPYRPDIFKKDIGIPVLMALMLFWAVSASWLLQRLRMTPQRIYAGAAAVALVVLTTEDKPNHGRNYSQKQAIFKLRDQPGPLVVLPADCRVLTWELVLKPEDSKISVDMLRYWNVLSADKRFVQR